MSLNGDGFISRLDPNLQTLTHSTFLGGDGTENLNSMELDENGDIFVEGNTDSNDYPTTAGAYQVALAGDFDMFVTRIHPDLSGPLVASTLVGGTGRDFGFPMTQDTAGNVYVAVETQADDYPTTLGAFDTTFNGGTGAFPRDVVISMLNSTLTQLEASTYLGGGGNERPHSIVFDTCGNVLVAGSTSSTDYPVTSDAFDKTFNGGFSDAFVSKLDTNLSALTFAEQNQLIINQVDALGA